MSEQRATYHINLESITLDIFTQPTVYLQPFGLPNTIDINLYNGLFTEWMAVTDDNARLAEENERLRAALGEQVSVKQSNERAIAGIRDVFERREL